MEYFWIIPRFHQRNFKSIIKSSIRKYIIIQWLKAGSQRLKHNTSLIGGLGIWATIYFEDSVRVGSEMIECSLSLKRSWHLENSRIKDVPDKCYPRGLPPGTNISLTLVGLTTEKSCPDKNDSQCDARLRSTEIVSYVPILYRFILFYDADFPDLIYFLCWLSYSGWRQVTRDFQIPSTIPLHQSVSEDWRQKNCK